MGWGVFLPSRRPTGGNEGGCSALAVVSTGCGMVHAKCGNEGRQQSCSEHFAKRVEGALRSVKRATNKASRRLKTIVC